MRILDLLRRNPFRQSRQLVLDEAAPSQWPQQLTQHLGLDSEYKAFIDTVAGLHKGVDDSLKRFTDEDILAAIPDRSRTMNALHGNEYATQVRKLLKTVEFTTLFDFEKQQEAYFEANSGFKDQTAKNVSVLREFMSDELKATQGLLQELEDAIINFTKSLEDRRFSQVRKVKELQAKLQQLVERAEKYQKLLASLQVDLKRTQDKRLKLETEIKTQAGLVRNDSALQAFEKLKKIEEDLHKTAALYVSVSQDLKNVYKRYPALKPTPQIRHVAEELIKDPLVFLSQNAEPVTKAFEEAVSMLEDEQPGNVRSLIERLSRLGSAAESDGRKMATAQPDQRAYKREIMKDIAALNIYDQQQFLLRAQVEEEAVATKISYLNAELDPNKRLAMEREMKDAAKSLGAVIKNDAPVVERKEDKTEVIEEVVEETPEKETPAKEKKKEILKKEQQIPKKEEKKPEKKPKEETKSKKSKPDEDAEAAEDIEPEHEA